jgi:hypothetical protein
VSSQLPRIGGGGAVLLAVGLLTSCVTPAPSTSAYESKAAMTAQAAVSSVRTALLAEQSAARDGVTGPYLETVVMDAENDFGSVQNTFDSVQPPDTPGADRLRDQLDPLLEQAGSGLEDLRIAVRRDSPHDMAQAADDLRPVADKLDAFAQEHQS